MPSYKTIKENLDRRLSESLSEISTPTLPSMPQMPQRRGYFPSFEEIQGMQGPDVAEQDDDRNMLQGLGRALWVGGTTFAETATFGVGKLAGIKAPQAETTGEKIGQAIGGAAGFLVPFGAGKAAVSAVGRAFAGKASTKAIEKSISGGVKEILRKKKSGFEYTGKLEGIDKTDDALKLFDETIVKDTLVKPIGNIEKAFKSSTARKEFAEQVDDQAGIILKELGERGGFQFSDDAAKEINKLVGKVWADAGKRPIKDLQGLIAKQLGDGKAASFYSHLFEEAVIFAGVENLMHGINVAAGEVDADFTGTTAHAFLLGHLLGGVRFVPGGIRGGTLGIFNKQGRERAADMIRMAGTYGKKYDTSILANQKAINLQYGTFAKMRENPTSGSAIGVRLESASEYARPEIKAVVDKALQSRNQGLDYSYSSLKEILENGTKEERKAVAELMVDGLGFVGSQLQREWRKDFIRTWASDWAGSTPRMLIGGLAMGNVALFDENIPFEDKLITFATGAFLMKSGKELTYRGSDGSYKVRESLRDFPERLKNVKEMYDAVGVDINHPLWFRMVNKVGNEQKGEHLLHDTTDPKQIQKIVDIATSKNEKGQDNFTTQSDKTVTPRKPQKGAPGSNIEAIYNTFTEMNTRDSIIGEGKRFLEWSELTLKQKREFEKQIDKNEIYEGMDIYDMYVDANTAKFENVSNNIVEQAKEAARVIQDVNNLPLGEPLVEKRSDGTEKLSFKPIDARFRTDLTDGQKYAINQYNAMLSIIGRRGVHTIDHGRTIKLDNSTKGLNEFTQRIENSIDRLNNELGLVGIEKHVTYTEGWLKDGFKLLDLRKSIKDLSNNIETWFKADPKTSNHSQLLRDIYFETGDGLVIANQVKVKGVKSSSKEQQFVDTMHPLIKLLNESIDSRVTGVTHKTREIEASKVRELMELFENSGITEFNNPNLRAKVQFMQHVRHDYLRNRLKEVRMDDGKGGTRPLNRTDIAILQRFIDYGLQNNSLTIKPIQQIMFDIESSGVFRELPKGSKQAEFIKYLELEGFTPEMLGAAKNIWKELSRLNGKEDMMTFGQSYLKDLKNFIEPYLEQTITLKDGTTAKVGLLRQSTKQEANIPIGNLATMVMELSYIKSGIIPAQAKRMLQSMREELVSAETESKQMMTILLDQMAFNGGDAIKTYGLAVEHGIWNRKSETFNNLSETQINTAIKNLLGVAKRDWGIETKAIEELMESMQKSDALNTGSEGFRTVTLSEMVNKITGFKLDGDFADNPSTGLTHSQQIKSKFFSKKYGNGTKLQEFLNDFEANIVKNNPSKSVDEVVGQLSKAMIDMLSSRNVRRLSFSQLKGTNSTWSDAVVKESAAMKLVSEAIGEKIGGVDYGNIVLVESSGRGRDGKIKNLSESDYYDSVSNKLYQGDYQASYAEFGDAGIFLQTEALRGVGNTPYVVWRMGNSDWAYGIEKGAINTIGKNYYDFVKLKQKEGILSESEVNTLLKEQGITEVQIKNADGKVIGKTGEIIVPEAAKVANELVHRMMNDMVIGKIIGDRWWTENMRDFTEAGMANLVKRTALFNNISGNRLTSKNVKELASYLDKSGAQFTDKAIVSKRLKELGDGKLNEVVLADESINADGKLDKMNPLHSIHQQVIKSYQEAIDAVGKNTELGKELSRQRDQAINEMGKDASDMNSVTFVDEKMFKALSYLFGATESTEIGGIKPVVLGFDGAGRFFVNKTAFVKNAEMQKIFDANPDVALITFTSASKQVGGKYGSDYKVMESYDLKKLGQIDNNFKNKIFAEDLNLLQIKGDKTKASLPPNHSTHFRTFEKVSADKSVNEFYNYYISEKMDRAVESMSRLKNPDNHHSIVAEFRNQLSKQMGTLNSDIDISQNQIGVEKMWADANGMPTIFKRQWENRLKQKYIDDIIRLKIDGGQAVLSPDVSITSKPLKQTLFRENGEVFQYGEIEIGGLNAAKRVDINNLQFIERLNTGNDKIIHGADIKKQLQGIGTLGEAKAFADGKGWQVGIVVERNPHTKPDSVLVLGLKGFRGESEGNNAVVNSGDVKRALEGDYDIDTVNFWWNSPKEVFKQYTLGRGTVTDSRPMEVKQSSYKGLSLKSAEDMRLYSDRMNHSDYIKGTIMNAQRVVQWLYNYNSTTPYGTKGAVIKIGQNRFAVLREGEGRKRAEQQLADMQQTILDAANGYDINTFKNYETVMGKILFGENGIFEVRNFDTKKRKLVESKDLVSGSEQQIILNLVQHYRNLMSISNKIYDMGQAKKVGFSELMSAIREYDYAMANASKNAFKGVDKLEAKELKEAIGDDPYLGFHRNARLFGSKKGESLRSEQGMLPYDRVMANLMHINDMSLDMSTTKMDKTNRFADEIALLSESKKFSEAYAQLNESIIDGFKQAEIANAINKQIRDLYNLRNQYSSESSRNYYTDRIKKLTETRDKLNQAVAKKFKKDKRYQGLRDSITQRYAESIRIKNRKDNIEMSEKDVMNQAKKMFKENGIPVESITSSEIVSALAMQEAFGNFAYRNGKELGLEGTTYTDMMKDVSALRKDFAKAWQQWRRQDGTWVNENHIYSHFLERIDNIHNAHGADNIQMRNLIVARIASPNSNMTKFGTYRGELFPMPEYKGMHKFVNLALRYNQSRNTPEVAMMMSRYMSDAYSKAELRLRGKDTGIYDTSETRYASDKAVEGTFWFNPFEYSTGHARDMFLHAMAGNASILKGKNFSRLDEYQKLHAAFGSGMIRDIINNERMLNIPHAAVTKYSQYGKDYAVNSYGGVQKAFDNDASMFISTKGERSVLSETFWEYESNMGFNSGGFGKSKNALEYVEAQVKQAKEGCF